MNTDITFDSTTCNNMYIIEHVWMTAAGFLACVVRIKLSSGHRCGYVAIPDTNKLYGVEYDQQAEAITQEAVSHSYIGKKSPLLVITATVNSDDPGTLVRRSPDILIDVHGGLTYSGNYSNYPVTLKYAAWWFGFDCNHYGDDMSIGGQSLDYCIADCESLATQLSAFN